MNDAMISDYSARCHEPRRLGRDVDRLSAESARMLAQPAGFSAKATA